jgi:predicted site-specific integrase-resolvase
MKNTYSIREFGSLVGKATKTLQRWDREGTLKAYRSATNRRYYTHDQYLQVMRRDRVTERKRILYVRVSSSSQKKDLLSQKKALEDFCVASGKTMDERLEDIGSGLNYNRKFFTLLMEKVE